MKNVALVVVALGMVACNNGRGPSLVDSGGIVLTDTGGGGRDTGPAPHDSGSGGTTCGTLSTTGGSWPALPSTCLPRCSTATGNQYNTCAMMTDQTAAQACIDAALMADHTPTVSVTDGTNTVMISCGGNSTDTFGCLDWQLNAAIDQSCDTEFTAYLTCAAGLPAGTSGMTGCPTEYGNVNTCITTNMSAIQTAYGSLGMACFGG